MKQKFNKGASIFVYDKMQNGYCYRLSCEPGQAFDPHFTPELSPQEMLERGVFEGHYMTDCQEEFPPQWFKRARFNSQEADVSCNQFQVKSRQGLSIWRKKGWIIGLDVRGWFQWYCRYFLGRRLPEIDAVQIARWRAFYRHKAQVLKYCPPKCKECRARQRQALLQWAYNPDF